MSYVCLAALSYLAASLATWAIIKAGITDAPVSRSSHSLPTPTAGGISIPLAALCFVAFAYIFRLDFDVSRMFGGLTPFVLGGVFCAALLGFLDDIFHYGSKRKFAAMLILSALSIYVLGPVQGLPLGSGAMRSEVLGLPPWLGYCGGALWIFTVMNVVNFMDGANGMLGLNMLVATVAAALLLLMGPALSIPLFWCGALIVGLAAFSQFNARNGAKVFAGDVGSLSAGYLYAVIILLAALEAPRSGALYLGPLFLLPFFTDVFLTLIRRLRGGHNVLHAHNTHLFQRLIRGGRSHIRVSLYYGAAGLICAAIGLLAEGADFARSPLLLLVMSVIAAFVYSWVYKTKGQI